MTRRAPLPPAPAGEPTPRYRPDDVWVLLPKQFVEDTIKELSEAARDIRDRAASCDLYEGVWASHVEGSLLPAFRAALSAPPAPTPDQVSKELAKWMGAAERESVIRLFQPEETPS